MDKKQPKKTPKKPSSARRAAFSKSAFTKHEKKARPRHTTIGKGIFSINRRDRISGDMLTLRFERQEDAYIALEASMRLDHLRGDDAIEPILQAVKLSKN